MYDADLIIVGSGIAGLFGAIKGAEAGLNILLVSKEGLLESNSRYAQGGIAAALGEHDSPELHFADTIKAGDGLCHHLSVDVLVNDGVDRVKELLDLGVAFDTYGDELALTKEGAHSQKRILHAGGDATGREIVQTLMDIVLSKPNITIRDNFFVTRLLVDADTGKCVGIEGFEENCASTRLYARYTMLATGGSGQMYLHTTNPPTATGDGMALAFLAGAKMADMEFIQFHPTALSIPGQNPSFLISETVRGEGAILRNASGERFMPGYHPLGELAPRDIVSRGIVAELAKTGTDKVYLDFTSCPADKARKRFPTIFTTCERFGLDISKEYIPVAPAAHYYMGGVRSDIWGRTSISNLFACGEVACTYCHGANRLGSNSLLEGLVFAYRAIISIIRNMSWTSETGAPEMFSNVSVSSSKESLIDSTESGSGEAHRKIDWLKHLMWTHVGILRDINLLNQAYTELQNMLTQECNDRIPLDKHRLELRNMLIVAIAATKGAMTRTESRGGHYRTDYPERNSDWLKHIVIAREG